MTHATRKRLAARALLAAAVLSAIVSGAEAGQKHRLFVSNLDGSINIYSANIHDTDVALLGTITAGATRPEGIWIDGDGTLYLVNGEGGTGAPDIAEYKKGASQPFRTISNGLYYPGFVAVGSDGTVYVNSVDGDSTGMVIEYAPGKTRPERTITLPDPAYALAPGGMAFDAGGNLLVATLGNVSTVHVYRIPFGTSDVTDLGLQSPGGAALGVDGQGNLYVGGQLGYVAVYAPGATTSSRTVPLDFYCEGLTVAKNGTIYAVGEQSVVEFAPGAVEPTNAFSTLNGETFTFDAALGPR
ncbi:MAG TPA: hypothetical protein VKR31_09350 [Rhizomicrobium sp.]|nr:hypothetical protein [Rhizomicrobium sp.]